MTMNHETLADLEAIFRDGITAVTAPKPSKRELKTVLNRLDAVVARGGNHFTPADRPDLKGYYVFLREWFENDDQISAKLNARYEATIKAVAIAIFERTFDGLLYEAMEEKPDIEFLEACLEDIVLLSCDCDDEEERTFLVLPSNLHVVALDDLGAVEELDTTSDESDVIYLRERFDRFKNVLEEKVCTLDKDRIFSL